MGVLVSNLASRLLPNKRQRLAIGSRKETRSVLMGRRSVLFLEVRVLTGFIPVWDNISSSIAASWSTGRPWMSSNRRGQLSTMYVYHFWLASAFIAPMSSIHSDCR